VVRTWKRETVKFRADYRLFPSESEVVEMCLELIEHYGWIKTYTLIGVPSLTMRNWVSQHNLPSRSAVRAIWYTWCLLLHPKLLRSEWDIVTWGRFSVRRQPHTPRGSVPKPQVKDGLRPYRKRTATMDPLTGEDWTI